MPEFMRINSVVLYVYSNEGNKPHIHIKFSEFETQIWLDDLTIKKSSGSKQFDEKARKLAMKHKETLLEAWYDYFK